jgi:hypothetical protein
LGINDLEESGSEFKDESEYGRSSDDTISFDERDYSDDIPTEDML